MQQNLTIYRILNRFCLLQMGGLRWQSSTSMQLFEQTILSKLLTEYRHFKSTEKPIFSYVGSYDTRQMKCNIMVALEVTSSQYYLPNHSDRGNNDDHKNSSRRTASCREFRLHFARWNVRQSILFTCAIQHSFINLGGLTQ